MVGEPGEARSVEVERERRVGGAEQVDAHVELFTADEQRVGDVLLNYVGFGLRVLGVVSEVVLPLRDLLYFIEEEDALSL